MVNYNTYSGFMDCADAGMLLLTIVFSSAGRGACEFIFSSLTVICIILTAGITLFPFSMLSSMMPNASLTLWNVTLNLKTLKIMTVAAIIFVPIMLLYTIGYYYKILGRITKEYI